MPDEVRFETDWADEPRMRGRRHIALVGHDNMKIELAEWARHNRAALAQHVIYATGSTGRIVREELDVPVRRFLSGPIGGDQQIGACIAQGIIDVLIFFWDPLQPAPHDPDVKALMRIATLWNVPVACNRATADLLITSPLFDGDYRPALPSFLAHTADPGRCVP